MTRRLITRIAAAAVAAVLATGCVTQPMDETALSGLDPELGATAAPIAPGAANDAVEEARALARQHAKKAKADKGVWVAPRKGDETNRGGGLVRDDEPTAGTNDADSQDNTGDGGETGQEGGTGGNDGGSGSQDRDRQAEPRDDNGGDDNDGNNTGGPGDEDPPGDDPSPRPRPAPEYRALAGVSDPTDDTTGQSPRYADIQQLLIESNGTRARVTVAVAAKIPAALNEGEVQGIGIDFYRSDDRESDYQLFVDGDDEGWRAFLHTPDGVIEYPGAFGVGGRVFVFELPWSALGGRKPADVNMFIDWSQRDTPLNKAGNDRAPDDTRVRVDPR